MGTPIESRSQPNNPRPAIVPEGITIRVGYVGVSSSPALPWGAAVSIDLGLEVALNPGEAKLHYLTEPGFIALCAACDAFREAARRVTPEATAP